jgi:hypothetical protein
VPIEVRRSAEMKRQQKRKQELRAACRKASEVVCQNADALPWFGLAGLSALTIVVLLHKRDVTLTPQPPDAGEQDREASERECEEWELKCWDLRSDYRDLMSE